MLAHGPLKGSIYEGRLCQLSILLLTDISRSALLQIGKETTEMKKNRRSDEANTKCNRLIMVALAEAAALLLLSGCASANQQSAFQYNPTTGYPAVGCTWFAN